MNNGNENSNTMMQPQQRTYMQRMRWTDSFGDTGYYTGEVNNSSIPDGRGSMEYDVGPPVVEEQWKEGEVELTATMEHATATVDNDNGGEGLMGGGGDSMFMQRKRAFADPRGNFALSTINEQSSYRQSSILSMMEMSNRSSAVSLDTTTFIENYTNNHSNNGVGNSSSAVAASDSIVDTPPAGGVGDYENDTVQNNTNIHRKSAGSENSMDDRESSNHNNSQESIHSYYEDISNRSGQGEVPGHRSSSSSSSAPQLPGNSNNGNGRFGANSLLGMANAPEPEDFAELEGIEEQEKIAQERQKRSMTRSMRQYSSSSFGGSFRNNTQPSQDEEDDAPIINNVKPLKSSEDIKKRKRKWCLFFTLFTLFCLGGVATICWYLLQDQDSKDNTTSTENNNKSSPQSNDAPLSNNPPTMKLSLPWDENAPCVPFLIQVVTDKFGNETSWELFYSESEQGITGGIGSELQFTERAAGTSTSTSSLLHDDEIDRKRLRQHSRARDDTRKRNLMGSLVLRSGPYPYLNRSDPTFIENISGTYTSSICLPKGYYKFVIYDKNGDGLCCKYGLGDYQLYFPGGRDVFLSTGQFMQEEVTEFRVMEEDIRTESPSSSMMPSGPEVVSSSPTAAPMKEPRLIPSWVKNMSTVSSRDLLMAGSSNSHGLLFDIQIHSNVSSLTIVGMDLLLEAAYSVEYEIWTKAGSWQDVFGNETNNRNYRSGFRQVSNGTINAVGTSDLSIIPLEQFQDVTIQGGARQAFWVTLKESSLLFQNHGRSIGSYDAEMSLISSPKFEVFYGSAVLQYPLEDADPGRDFRDDKGFLGKIFYVENAEAPSYWNINNQLSIPSLEPTVMVEKAPSQLSPILGTSSLEPSQSYPPSYDELSPVTATTSASYFPSPVIPAQSFSDTSTNTSNFTSTNTSNFTTPTSTESSTPNPQPSMATSAPSFYTTLATTIQSTPEISMNTSNFTTPASITANATSNTIIKSPSPTFLSNASSLPVLSPTPVPASNSPTFDPSNSLSGVPSFDPSNSPSGAPSFDPSNSLSGVPSFVPSNSPSGAPSFASSNSPSGAPSFASSSSPSGAPSFFEPSNSPSGAPSAFDPVLDYAKSLLIQGIHQSSLFGFSSSISDDGSLLAVGAMDAWNEFGEATGAVYLYSLDGFITNVVSSSQPKPFEILYGQSTGDDFGNAVALSRDGAHLVVGSRAENKGKGAIRIYQIIDDSVTLKYVFAGQNPSGRAGWSVAISGDGNIVAMGATKGGSIRGGLITTYQAPDWVPYGSVVEGLASGDVTGFSVTLSYDGAFMAIGSPKADKSNQQRNTGKTAVYAINDAINGTEWALRDEIFGGGNGDIDGTSVGLSQDGSILVVGGKGYSGNSKYYAGQCKIFEWKGNQFEILHIMVGQTKKEELGTSVAVSDDGNIIACGGITGRWGRDIATVSGVVQLWNRMTSREKVIWPQGDVASTVDEASFGSAVSLSSDGKLVVVGASTWRGSNNNSPGAVHIFDTNW